MNPYFQKVEHSEGNSSESTPKRIESHGSSSQQRNKQENESSKSDKEDTKDEGETDHSELDKAQWRLEEARKDPIHFRQFLRL